jgi:hypothetical protein
MFDLWWERARWMDADMDAAGAAWGKYDTYSAGVIVGKKAEPGR